MRFSPLILAAMLYLPIYAYACSGLLAVRLIMFLWCKIKHYFKLKLSKKARNKLWAPH